MSDEWPILWPDRPVSGSLVLIIFGLIVLAFPLRDERIVDLKVHNSATSSFRSLPRLAPRAFIELKAARLQARSIACIAMVPRAGEDRTCGSIAL